MKRWLVFLLAGLILSLSAGFCLAQDDVAKQASCKYCGMDRKTFAHSRMLVTYEDGSSMGTCSLHCTAIELALNIDKTPKSIEVGDFKTKKLIDAEKASWVIGGSKTGVMTKTGQVGLREQGRCRCLHQGKRREARLLRRGDQGLLRGHVRRHEDDPR